MFNRIFILSLLSFCVTTSFERGSNQETDSSNERIDTIAFDYNYILAQYYNRISRNCDKVSEDFPSFKNNYYDSRDSWRDIVDYTNSFALRNNVIDYELSSLNTRLSFSSNYVQNRDSLPDADYILSSSEYDFTPLSEFSREPVMEAFDCSFICDGDIVYETQTTPPTGHNALIFDYCHDGYYGEYIQTIEAVGNGVQFGFLDDIRIVDYKVKILRVIRATPYAISNAKFFTREQLGKDYSLHLGIHTSIASTEWYCSELVYASYYYSGIDIGVQYTENGLVYPSNSITPADIFNSMNTHRVTSSEIQFLSLGVISKNGTAWTIRVYNPNLGDFTLSYNSKLSFFNDPFNWTNLTNIVTTEIESVSSVYITVNENFFATTVATCIIYNEYRYITCGNYLNSANHSLTSSYNTIEA